MKAMYIVLFCLIVVSVQAMPLLLAVEDNAIIFIHGKSTVKHPVTSAMAVDYDIQRKYVYYSTTDSKILRIKFEDFGKSSDEELILSIGSDCTWAIDWVHNTLFWVDKLGNHTLHVMDLNNKMTKSLASIDIGEVTMRQIVLDPLNKYIYFFSSNGVDRIGMDGSSRQNVVRDMTLRITHAEHAFRYLTLDFENDKLYFNGYVDLPFVWSANFDGTSEEMILLPYGGAKAMKGLQVFKGNIYYLQQKNYIDDVLKEYNPQTSTLTEKDTQSVWHDFKIFDDAAKKQGVDPCGSNNGGCSHLCLPKTRSAFTCKCPDTSKEAGHTCVDELK